MSTIVVSSYQVASFSEGGGHYWVYMQYIQALRRAGCEVFWMEEYQPSGDVATDERALAVFRKRAADFGLEGKLLLYRWSPHEARPDWIDVSAGHAAATLQRADLLLNFHYAISPALLELCRRTALVDIDPGLLQHWIENKLLEVAPHDVYLTTGETVGSPEALFPDCGVEWIYFRPPVDLEQWCASYDASCESFTTVSGWSADSWIPVDEGGEQVLKENTKRVAFLEYADLPRHTPQRLELALDLAASDAAERRLLETRGWCVRDARETAGSPVTYRDYIQSSRGELSCAKPSCLWFQNAWVSDRTVCYLASGKPVVVQHTGPSTYLPDGEGMFRFRSLEEAADALARINADYSRHARAARELAESYFDASVTVPRLVDAALA